MACAISAARVSPITPPAQESEHRQAAGITPHLEAFHHQRVEAWRRHAGGGDGDDAVHVRDVAARLADAMLGHLGEQLHRLLDIEPAPLHPAMGRQIPVRRHAQIRVAMPALPNTGSSRSMSEARRSKTVLLSSAASSCEM
jgi:hypothetical protein